MIFQGLSKSFKDNVIVRVMFSPYKSKMWRSCSKGVYLGQSTSLALPFLSVLSAVIATMMVFVISGLDVPLQGVWRWPPRQSGWVGVLNRNWSCSVLLRIQPWQSWSLTHAWILRVLGVQEHDATIRFLFHFYSLASLSCTLEHKLFVWVGR